VLFGWCVRNKSDGLLEHKINKTYLLILEGKSAIRHDTEVILRGITAIKQFLMWVGLFRNGRVDLISSERSVVKELKKMI
jgi:hypothetical protein